MTTAPGRRDADALRAPSMLGVGRMSWARPMPPRSAARARADAGAPAGDRARDRATAVPASGDEAHDRPEAPRRRGTEHVQAGQRALAPARQDRIAAGEAHHAEQLPVEELVAGHVDLV